MVGGGSAPHLRGRWEARANRVKRQGSTETRPRGGPDYAPVYLARSCTSVITTC